MNVVEIMRKFAADDSGATAIEYGLIASLIFVAIISAVGSTGQSTAGAFQQVEDDWAAAR